MPVKRAYTSVPVKVIDGGKLLPDLPVGNIGAANYDEKINFRRELGEEVKAEGWDYPAPLVGWAAENFADFNDGLPAEEVAFVRRPNATAAVVGCGAGFIKYFDYDTDAWVTIGDGYSQIGDSGFRRWRILDVAGYAVFNNGKDLPATWQVGDAAVRPMYEFREAGYASAGDMVEYVDGVVMFYDIVEINDSAMEGWMNDVYGDAYGLVPDALTTHIGFRRVWSAQGDPTSIAATVPGSILIGTNDLTLAWPMVSFETGDSITVIGAGTAGGNLTTTITAVTGTGVTLADNANTTVSNADVQQTADLTSISGWDDIEDDGSALACLIVLKTQLINLKASGHIWQTYYTGDIDTPFANDRVTKKAGAAPRFPRAVAVMNSGKDEYIIFPGAKHFFRFGLGSQAVEQDTMFIGAEKELFFNRIAGAARYSVFCADNVCTDEMLFIYPWEAYEEFYYGANRALALRYAKGDESLAEISGFNFTCAAAVKKPTAGLTADELEDWFIMGDGEGKITLFGKTNLAVLTRRRYGELFEASIAGGLISFGTSDNGKYVRRFSLNPSNPQASAAIAVTIYGARAPNVAAVALETKTLTDPQFPGTMGLYYRKPWFKYRLVSDTDQELKISGHIWRVGDAETQDIDRLA